ncbi:MAG TPA: Co2+/Mg2+ efflux protein ApaG [Alphaproteobacteria bacterium]|nr:Co2+/Mg2+ efflux protein ApaG [Alphaproteobacteria bacterium]
MYSATTRGITVNVRPQYLNGQSEPEQNRYLWAYHIRIENRSGATVQLLNRYWQITDAMARVEEVRGPGVIGKQPVLEPGESFEYTSGCPLQTPSGFMVGHYEMITENGERFEVEIPTFSLDSPFLPRQLN